jgi:MFS family permease
MAIGLLSLFSDMGHELTTAVMPLFLATFGQGAAALGLIEGVSDAASSLMKLWMSHHSDKIGKRKPILAIGYLVTAMMGTFAFVTAWWQMLVIRTVAWLGRGARGPVRDALLSESVPEEAHGRAFGFEGAMDTVGAVIGPAVALALIGVLPLRQIFLLAFIPGAITVLIVLFWLKDPHREAQPNLRFMTSLKELPAEFKKYLLAVGVFGVGNFAHTLLMLRCVTLLSPTLGAAKAGQIAIGLYIFHNVLYAACSYPVGWLGDRMSKKTLLSIGYALFAAMCIGFLYVSAASMPLLIGLFALAGIYIAIVDAMQRAIAAGMLPSETRATGYGALATVNSIGDFVSSAAVGLLFANVSYSAGFLYAACFTILGAISMAAVSERQRTG